MAFRSRFIANIIQFAAQQGASPKQLLALTGMEMSDLERDDLMIETGIYNKVVEEAVKQTGDENFGLHLGEYLSLSAAGLIVQIVQSSRTVQEALHFMVEFANLGCQSMPFQLVEDSDYWKVSLHPNPAWEEQSSVAVRQTMDGMVTFTLREFHTLTRQKHFPKRIHFSYTRPERFLEYERIFNCPIYFSQKETALFLDKKQVAEPVVTSDYNLLQILVQYAEKKLVEMQSLKGFVSVVRQSIIHLVKPQFPTIEQVAANLNISVRTLQRRLKEENQTFKTVMDELKKQFALDYLNNPSLSIKEIAYLLDYADSSSFIRSFKRWKGMSPEVYRKG